MTRFTILMPKSVANMTKEPLESNTALPLASLRQRIRMSKAREIIKNDETAHIRTQCDASATCCRARVQAQAGGRTRWVRAKGDVPEGRARVRGSCDCASRLPLTLECFCDSCAMSKLSSISTQRRPVETRYTTIFLDAVTTLNMSPVGDTCGAAA